MSVPSLRRVLAASAVVSIGGLTAVPTVVPSSTPSASGTVLVRVADDQPIAGVAVEAYADATLATHVGGCTTGDDGTCTVDGLAPGTVWLVAASGPPSGTHLPLDTVTTTFEGEVRYAVSVDVPDVATATDPPVEAPPIVLRRVDPALRAACGLRVRLVFDLSSSVSPAEAELLRMAAIGFVDALTGTPTEIAVGSFATSAPAAGNADLGFTSVATPGGALGVRAAIAALTPPAGDDGFTNWDAGLRAAAAAPGARADVVVVLTDGSPTVMGVPAVYPPVVTDLDQIAAGVRAANALKVQGIRVVAVGVGDAFEVAAPNLVAISGPVEGSDVTRTSFAGLPAVFAGLAGALCPTPEPPTPPAPPEPEPAP
ncbi:MAG: vWA domain-containing protein, partial [Actinomycetes bacterium]